MVKEGATLVTINIDKKVKDEAIELFSELGLTMSSAFNIFLRQCIIEGGLPFEIKKKQE